jgi:hypothetical protein
MSSKHSKISAANFLLLIIPRTGFRTPMETCLHRWFFRDSLSCKVQLYDQCTATSKSSKYNSHVGVFTISPCKKTSSAAAWPQQLHKCTVAHTKQPCKVASLACRPEKRGVARLELTSQNTIYEPIKLKELDVIGLSI